MLEGAERISKYEWLTKWIPSVILLPVCIFFLMNRGQITYVDQFHKVVHLSGQGIFGLMGDIPSVLGGTITQLLVPVLLIIFFYVNYLRKWLQLSFFLLGHTFLNISMYAGDAVARKFDLFGPTDKVHDWNWMLTFFDALQYHTQVSDVFFILGAVFFLIAILVPKIVP